MQFNFTAAKTVFYGAIGWIGASAIDELMSQYVEINPWWKLAAALLLAGYGFMKG